ncbi:MAG: hypothetical protein L3J43_06540 [Sulfurovum sp.]|nr:hypothetical protein [Sulfurovum sp.]
MFKSNTQKEIFYIFVWLIGIILLYTLVHTFILEPSQDKNETPHDAHTLQSHTIHQTTHLVSENKIDKVKSEIKQPKIPEIPKKTETSIQTPIKSTTTKQTTSIEKNKTPTPQSEKIELNIEEPKAIPTPNIPKAVDVPTKILSIPTTPTLPSVPSVPNTNTQENKKETTERIKPLKKEALSSKENGQIKKVNNVSAEREKTLNTDINIKRIETERQQVIREAQTVREEAIKLLAQ